MRGLLRIMALHEERRVLEALRRRFASEAGFAWCGAFTAAGELAGAAAAAGADVVFVDFEMAGVDPLWVVRELAGAAPQARVIALAGDARREPVERALAAGVRGYLSKHEATAELVSAARRVGRGEVVLGGGVSPARGAGREAGAEPGGATGGDAHAHGMDASAGIRRRGRADEGARAPGPRRPLDTEAAEPGQGPGVGPTSGPSPAGDGR